MLSEEALRRALVTVGLTAPVRWDEVTESTNATALAMAAEGAPEWTLVAAGHQTAGRGRHGRVWVDRPGAALMCSLVLRPLVAPDRLGLMSLAAGVAMAEAASGASGKDVRCKWPNDLLVGESKVGGILGEAEIVEGRIRHVVVGVGVNLHAPEGVDGAGAIGDVDEEALLTGFLERFRSLVEGSLEEIPARWRAVSHSLGRTIEGTTVGGNSVRGVAVDLDDTGGLGVDTTTGRATLRFGEVRYLEHVPRKPRGLFGRFTQDARGVVGRADQISVELGHERIGPGHMLVALAEVGPNGATRALESVRFQVARAKEDLVRIVEVAVIQPGAVHASRTRRRLSRAFPGRLEPTSKKVFETSLRVALRLGHDWIGVEHILLAVLERGDPEVVLMLSSQQASVQRIHEELMRELPSGKRRLRPRGGSR